MNKQLILDHIKASAKSNGGAPPGAARFATETKIKQYHWQKYWPRWSDALREAGFSPNQFTQPMDEMSLIETLVEFIREVGCFPTDPQHRVKSHSTPNFPSPQTFGKLGSRNQRIARVLEYCRARDGFEDIVKICEATPTKEALKSEPEPKDEYEIGDVYLLKSGRFYKLGRSNAFGRRERELSIQLPDKSDTVHVIKTDDPVGIEAYWHKRFETKRKNGEWFELSAEDVRAFKRRKVFM
ncbi:MAG: GIY-YIG nuclease family protein [Methylocystis sp.]|nr:GIY-YIG nuclease family protein [Methylocystis sp.]MBI3275022.1 GIY-YIG nuclease family protein [Methylocystis sp.]